MSFQRTETVVSSLEIKDRSGEYYDPATSTKITIEDPTGTVVANNQPMQRDAKGKYHYDYTSAADAVLGLYDVRIIATDAARVTIKDSRFDLEI